MKKADTDETRIYPHSIGYVYVYALFGLMSGLFLYVLLALLLRGRLWYAAVLLLLLASCILVIVSQTKYRLSVSPGRLCATHYPIIQAQTSVSFDEIRSYDLENSFDDSDGQKINLPRHALLPYRYLCFSLDSGAVRRIYIKPFSRRQLRALAALIQEKTSLQPGAQLAKALYGHRGRQGR
ncbi:MAG: hypothetical protein P4L75_04750 [Clostridia bacterium]|nr:hypothetical protein [Clostridia bacterium]MDR3644384.1 hypothetical protein [Clostridia bacterium]